MKTKYIKYMQPWCAQDLREKNKYLKYLTTPKIFYSNATKY